MPALCEHRGWWWRQSHVAAAASTVSRAIIAAHAGCYMGTVHVSRLKSLSRDARAASCIYDTRVACIHRGLQRVWAMKCITDGCNSCSSRLETPPHHTCTLSWEYSHTVGQLMRTMETDHAAVYLSTWWRNRQIDWLCTRACKTHVQRELKRSETKTQAVLQQRKLHNDLPSIGGVWSQTTVRITARNKQWWRSEIPSVFTAPTRFSYLTTIIIMTMEKLMKTKTL